MVDDSDMTSGAEKFFAKGVAYSPIPAGSSTYLSQLGDWFYDVPGITGAWSQIWERDLPKMKATGLNVLKTYFFWPKDPPSSDQMTNWKTIVGAEKIASTMTF
ncbi:hypothetical protein [Breoghania sp.]|uniref:hypothetical protein n=1 Tax=Breoghania sp. TaxID=2065378 RepID=UPI0026061BC1|nr:hypothetical protein [Breoghania sp.]MDJ0931452.1 hypothetical protein [Breoghania sp.]